jgi:hypothetical protein
MIIDLLLSKLRFIVPTLLVLALFSFVGQAPEVTVDSSALGMAAPSVVALSVGAIAAILGMWVGRNPASPTRNAKLMTVLILAAVMVGVFHAYLDADEMIAQEQDLDRIMETIREIAIASGDEEIARVMESDFGVVIDVPENAGSAGEDTGMAGEADTGAPEADADIDDAEPEGSDDAPADSQ